VLVAARGNERHRHEPRRRMRSARTSRPAPRYRDRSTRASSCRRRSPASSWSPRRSREPADVVLDLQEHHRCHGSRGSRFQTPTRYRAGRVLDVFRDGGDLAEAALGDWSGFGNSRVAERDVDGAPHARQASWPSSGRTPGMSKCGRGDVPQHRDRPACPTAVDPGVRVLPDAPEPFFGRQSGAASTARASSTPWRPATSPRSLEACHLLAGPRTRTEGVADGGPFLLFAGPDRARRNRIAPNPVPLGARP
jgi:hypothetical protein